jgi:FkbM family methyltransferase
MNWSFMLHTGPRKWISRKLIWKLRKMSSDPIRLIKLPTGLELLLFPNNTFSSDVFVTGCDLDWGAEALFARFLSREGALLDIGAHIGYYSLYMLPRVKEVYAFDPNPDVQDWLSKNLDRFPNTRVVQMALGANSGRKRFIQTAKPDFAHLDNGSSDPSAIEVDVVTIDEFISKNELTVTGVKIDVEGSDIDVITGGRRTLIKQQPLVLTEAKPGSALLEALAGTNYSVFGFTRRNDWNGKTTFRQIADETKHKTKMLFLVPPRLRGEFQKLGAR